MTRSKNTKRALLASIMSLVLCFAMLIGTTFAWFTDSTSTGVNKIQAGTLDIDLVNLKTNESLEGKTIGFVNEKGEKVTNILWEPGCRYLLEPVALINKGNLWAKYKLIINADTDSVDLTKVIDVYEDNNKIDTLYNIMHSTNPVKKGVIAPKDTAGSTLQFKTLKLVMQESAGNEYQGKTIENISITVVATQHTEEKDSIDNQYDFKAEYPEVKTAADAASFAEALNEVNTGSNKNVAVKVDKAIENITGIKTESGNSLSVDFGGNEVTVKTPVGSANTKTNGMQLLKDSTVVLKNGTYKPASTDVAILIQNYSNLTIENMTLDASNSSCNYVLSCNNGTTVITGNTNITAPTNGTALDVMYWVGTYPDGSTVIIDENMTGTVDGKIDVYKYANNTVDKNNPEKATLIIKGGTFKNTGLNTAEFEKFVAEGYKVVENNGVYTVSKNQ